MKCKNECGNEARGNGSYCSGTCKTIYNRNKRRSNLAVTPTVTVYPGNEFVTVADETVYGRPAVHWNRDEFNTRPEPLDSQDKPHAGGRGKYTRADESVYQFDVLGKPFEVIDGKVYQDIDKVQECYAEAV